MSQKKKNNSEKKDTKVNKSKKKVDTSIVIIIIGLIIIAIPFLVLGFFLISDSMKTGTPITGDRFTNDLNPAITESDISSVNSAVSAISGVESVETVLKTATLRVYVDTEDNKTIEEIEKIAEDTYTEVTDVLDESVYFTRTETKKMYDIEVHVFNLSDNRESEEFIYFIASKTSSMEEHMIQLVSEPKDPELAQ